MFVESKMRKYFFSFTFLLWFSGCLTMSIYPNENSDQENVNDKAHVVFNISGGVNNSTIIFIGGNETQSTLKFPREFTISKNIETAEVNRVVIETTNTTTLPNPPEESNEI